MGVQKSELASKVVCRFRGCEKKSYRNGKAGRYYILSFTVIETGSGRPPLGTTVTRTVWGSPDNLLKQRSGLLDTMQSLSPHLHSPEQLLSESWEIVVGAGVVEEFDQNTGEFRGWSVKWLEPPTVARLVEPAAVTEPAPSAAATDTFDEELAKNVF